MAITLGNNIPSAFYLGNTGVTEIYHGSDKVWPPATVYSIYLQGPAASITQASLAGKLTGETISSYSEVGNDVFADSITTYTINSSGFLNLASLTSATFTGCTRANSAAFSTCTALTSVDLSSATTIGPSCFTGCSSLTSINLSGLNNDSTALGGNSSGNACFFNVASGGTLTIPIYFATNGTGGTPDGDVSYLINVKGWTINYI
jgi:hypothetical protein